MTHARLRRTSPISQYVVAAALEALGADSVLVTEGRMRLGVVLCVMSGCVNYSRRFYDEALRDPATASPLVFPETVFNAPASHLASLLGAYGYLGLHARGRPWHVFARPCLLTANWLDQEALLLMPVSSWEAEEYDWLTSDAYHLFSRRAVLSDGAGAVYLKTSADEGTIAELHSITDSHLFTRSQSRAQAAMRARKQLPDFTDDHILCDGLQNISQIDAAESAAWDDWRGRSFTENRAG